MQPSTNTPNDKLNRPTLERLLLYYHYINRHMNGVDTACISSAELAQIIGVDDTLVRKDFAGIGLKGRPRSGFVMADIKSRIRDILGFEKTYNAVLVGSGRLGGAIACYDEFRDYGLKIVAMFDNDLQKIGSQVGEFTIQPLIELAPTIQHQNIALGILTVPADAAQNLADQMIDAGIKGIWCFSPTHIVVPSHVVLRQEHLSVGIAGLSYHLRKLIP